MSKSLVTEADAIDLECRLLGALLLNNQPIWNLIRTRTVLTEHFRDQRNRLIWLGIIDLARNRQIANPVTIKQYIFNGAARHEHVDAKYLAGVVLKALPSHNDIPGLIKQWRDVHPDWWEWYNDYLSSEEWKLRRSKVMTRCLGLCEGCLDNHASQVHHLTYEHVGEEFLFELVGLCASCHDRLHHKEPHAH